jgi:outer membrane protein assembly factor BamE (lipoprotein component of BamABCDE complex)
MPHRDEFEDEDDVGYLPPPSPPRHGSNPTVIILVVLAVVALVGLVICGGLFAWTGARVAAPPEPQPAAGIYTRDELQRRVMGKTEQEVIDELGKPTIANEAGDSKEWIYSNRTINPVNRSIDPRVTIRLQGGKVVAIDF